MKKLLILLLLATPLAADVTITNTFTATISRGAITPWIIPSICEMIAVVIVAELRATWTE